MGRAKQQAKSGQRHFSRTERVFLVGVELKSDDTVNLRESLDELDRFCDAMIHIRKEIAKVESGAWSRDDNPLKFAPHSLESISGEWKHAYSRDEAVFPTEWTKARKFFPAVARINNALGDRQLMCTCPPLEAYAEA